jgi:hypothetical protein
MPAGRPGFAGPEKARANQEMKTGRRRRRLLSFPDSRVLFQPRSGLPAGLIYVST